MGDKGGKANSGGLSVLEPGRGQGGTSLCFSTPGPLSSGDYRAPGEQGSAEGGCLLVPGLVLGDSLK